MVKYDGEDGEGYSPGTTTNREVFGTWLRPFDYTLTLIGYTVGIHDFWRFPYLCYKFGGVFLVPILVLSVITAFPSAFMEITIGQYRGIGATEVFGVMAPILTGISYLLAWNSLTTCWVYTMMISWSRLYSSDASSCTRAWGGCLNTSYYNTPACFTGKLDLTCQMSDVNKSAYTTLYYNFNCMKVEDFCAQFGSTIGANGKYCIDAEGVPFSIYNERLHASVEYYYGGVCGLRRADENQTKHISSINDDILIVDLESTIEAEISAYSFTTFCMIAFLLYTDLLSVSAITYIFNGSPFIILPYFTYRALTFPNARRGIQEFMDSCSRFDLLLSPEIWVEAAIQILSTAGIGNGVLINLSTFNKFERDFLGDAIISVVLNIFVSLCATIICFCTIGHFLDEYQISLSFTDYIQVHSSHSSIEFGYIVYTQFINIFVEEHYTTVLFFFTITSFSMDSALRLVQNLLDAMVAIFGRLRSHRFATVVAICLFGYFAILPMTRNGGVVLFMEYEYFLLKFVWPFIVLVQTVGVTWVYKTSRILDNAEQMGIFSNKYFRTYITISLQYLTVGVLLAVLVHNVITHERRRFNHTESVIWNEIFGWVFVLTPVALLLLSIFEQLIVTGRQSWGSLFVPVKKVDPLNVARHSGISASQYGPTALRPTVDLTVHKLLQKWHQNLTFGLHDGTGNIPPIDIPLLKKREPSVKLPDDTRCDGLICRKTRLYIRLIKEHFELWPGRFDESDPEE